MNSVKPTDFRNELAFPYRTGQIHRRQADIDGPWNHCRPLDVPYSFSACHHLMQFNVTIIIIYQTLKLSKSIIAIIPQILLFLMLFSLASKVFLQLLLRSIPVSWSDICEIVHFKLCAAFVIYIAYDIWCCRLTVSPIDSIAYYRKNPSVFYLSCQR